MDRIRLLSSLFAIDVCAFAVLENHIHVVLKICPDQLDELTNEDVMDRWCAMFNGPLLVQRLRNGEMLSVPELATVADIARVWRERLSSISWFMRCLSQPIARQANLEDKCTGKFWESRFHSQALKTDEARLSCMAYVDLNPIRAGMEDTPETSDYTSIQERIKPVFCLEDAIQSQTKSGDLKAFNTPLKPLLHFEGNVTNQPQTGILFNLQDYLGLIDWIGRIIRNDKRGFIEGDLPPMK